jgi:hypothetical protein
MAPESGIKRYNPKRLLAHASHNAILSRAHSGAVKAELIQVPGETTK